VSCNLNPTLVPAEEREKKKRWGGERKLGKAIGRAEYTHK